MVYAAMDTRQVTLRIDMRVPVEMHEYLVNDARSKKLSFEGLLLTYIQEHIRAELQRQRGTKAR
jgi:hypothetical protein